MAHLLKNLVYQAHTLIFISHVLYVKNLLFCISTTCSSALLVLQLVYSIIKFILLTSLFTLNVSFQKYFLKAHVACILQDSKTCAFFFDDFLKSAILLLHLTYEYQTSVKHDIKMGTVSTHIYFFITAYHFTCCLLILFHSFIPTYRYTESTTRRI